MERIKWHDSGRCLGHRRHAMLLSLQTYQPQSLSPRCGVTLSRFTWYLHGIEYSWPMGSGTTRRCGHVGISRVVGPLSTLPQGMEIGQPRHSNLCQDVLGHKVATGHCSGDREAQSENRTDTDRLSTKERNHSPPKTKGVLTVPN